MAAGPLLGGVLIDARGVRDGVRLAFGAALAMAVLAAIVQQRLIEDSAADAAPSAPERNPVQVWRRMSASLRNLLLADILIRFCEQIPYAFMAIWCMNYIARPTSASQFGLLTAIEMMTAILVYIPVAWLADRSTKKPFVLATFVFFTLFPLALLFSRSFWLLVPTFVLRGLKEFGEPTRKALIMDLAPEDAKARMFGLYYLLRDLVVSIAAFSGGFLWEYVSPEANLLAAFLFGAAGTLWFAARGRDLAAAPGAPSLPEAPN